MTTFRTKVWRFCCSLKLAIVLASLATLLAMGGSLAIYARPDIYGNLDQLTLLQWWQSVGQGHIRHTWWLVLCGGLLAALALNTFCCLTDWLTKVHRRWRKTGEYLIHTGFCLLAVAFAVGHLYGFRMDRVQVFEQQLVPLPAWPGTYLKLDAVEPVLDASGRPLDMVNKLVLLQGDKAVTRAVARINHPLQFRGLVAVPVSFGRQARGFKVFSPTRGDMELTPGQTLDFNAARLTVLRFWPNAVADQSGRIRPGGDRLNNPAFLLRLERGDETWQGWYLPRRGLPFPLVQAGIRFWPTEPLFADFSILTVNRDPGSPLALAGGMCLLAGSLLALLSYYRKRKTGDHPDIH